MRTPRTRNAEAMSRIARTLLRVAMIVTPLFATAVALRADPPEDGKSRADELLALARREADSHVMRHGSDGRPLTLRPEPVLRWTNPLVGENYGAVFVWTYLAIIVQQQQSPLVSLFAGLAAVLFLLSLFVRDRQTPRSTHSECAEV